MKTEYEARFLEVESNDLVSRLIDLGAEDLGEALLREQIFYDEAGEWRTLGRFLRIREANGQCVVTYKENSGAAVDSAREINIDVTNGADFGQLFERIGLVMWRRQEKRRHRLVFAGCAFDIDTWPGVPPYVEVEGESAAAVRVAADRAGFVWSEASFLDARDVLRLYGVDLDEVRELVFADDHGIRAAGARALRNA